MRLIQTLSSCLCTGIIALFTACSQAPQSPHRFRESVYRHGISRTHVSRGHGSLRSGPTQSGHPERELGRLFRLSLQRFYLNGFSHTHLSGTGCIDLGDILFRPSLQTPLAFSHSDEKASPGYYSVNLREAGVLAELTTTPHVGIHRYTYKKRDRVYVGGRYGPFIG